MSESHEKRKSSKPLMEKRRRARINECLTELQAILEVVNGNTEATGGHSKREKAEILEQTVQLVKHIRYQDQPGPSAETVPQAQYRAGFNECLAQVGRFMEANNSALNADTRTGLLNHLAATLRSSASVGYNGYNTDSPASAGSYTQAVGAGDSTVEAATRRPVLDRRGSAPFVPTGPGPSPQSLGTPPRVSVPPLPPPPTAAAERPQASRADALPIQQSPRKGEHPTAVSNQPVLSAAAPGVPLPVNIQSIHPAAAGHVALVLPAQLLSSLVGGQFTTGQVIPLFQQQVGAPVICQQGPPTSGASVLLPAGSGIVGGVYPSPTPREVPKSSSQCVTTTPSTQAAGSGQLFIVSNPSFGYSPSTVPTYGVLGGSPSSSSSSNTRRDVVPIQSPPTAPSSAVAMETRSQNGVVYAPASLPMNLYVSPSAYSAGVNGPFANGLPLPNPSSLALGPHWRPWGWEPDQR